MKTVVIYYSLRGNTRKIAELAAAACDADIAEIEPIVPYVGEYMEIVDQGKMEIDEGIHPKIKPVSINLSEYDGIIIGSPTWWYTIAPVVQTFVKSQDWNGKTVIPFTTNGGWPGSALKDLEKECRGAAIKSGREIQFDSTGGNELVTPQADIDQWLAEISEIL